MWRATEEIVLSSHGDRGVLVNARVGLGGTPSAQSIVTRSEERSHGSSNVHSLERAFELLELLASVDGSSGLSELSAASGLPLATIHRLMATLVGLGYVRRAAARRYVLGPRLIHLGDSATRRLGTLAASSLAELVDLTEETANLAVLEGDGVVYLAQAPGRHAMRMFTEPGRRVDPHCTAVGKAMLAQLPTIRVREILSKTGMTRYTNTTITDIEMLLRHLEEIREQGYAMDEGEQEVGVRCIAVALVDGPELAAISVSGPSTRISDATVSRVVPDLTRVALSLSHELNATDDYG